MVVKKTELYSSLWKSCDELRGGMDASQYKDYVLVLLFVKYVSDKYADRTGTLIDVPEGGGFADMIALKGDKEIGDKMNKIIRRLADANELKGVIDVADFDEDAKLGKGQEKVDRLSNLVAIFQGSGLDFKGSSAEGDDLLGDAYEYLMRHFATESGKSKGQFYTPAEVSRVIAKVIGISKAKSQSETVYDPTCGSGSLLLKAHDEAPVDVTIYGQEMDNATNALAKMNMIMHGCIAAAHDILQGNTLANPLHLADEEHLKTFDFVVANPPFSNKAWRSGFDPANDLYERFTDGIPPAKNGDYAFLLHVIKSLKSTGRGAIIMPHGVLFRGNVEADIRRNIIRRGYIKGIIGLPPNLFYGTGISACLIVLDKEEAATRKGIFMIDASKGFMKDGPKNRLRHQDIHKIVDVFNKQLEIPKYSRMVSVEKEIGDPKNDYNLNIPRYIDSSEPEDLQYIDAHLKGGIPNPDVEALDNYWQVLPSLKGELFAKGDRPGYSRVKVEASEIKPTIYNHKEFADYIKVVKSRFSKWQSASISRLKNIAFGDKPKELIEILSENILQDFAKVQLIDPYDIYQHMMTYWTETMQDDVYMIVAEGWGSIAKLRLIVEDKKNKSKEKPDFVISKRKYKADFIPSDLIIDHYFSEEKKNIETLEANAEAITRQMEEMAEEHGAEEGLLYDAKTDANKLTKGSVTARLKEIKDDEEADDERKVLKEYLDLTDKESKAKKKVKDAQDTLKAKVISKYGKLSEEEIKVLLVDEKWLSTLYTAIQTELDRVSQALAGRVKQLAERYANTLPELTDEVKTQSAKVDEHLMKMGFLWK